MMQYSTGTKRRQMVLDLGNKLRKTQSSEVHFWKIKHKREQFIYTEYPHVQNLRMMSPDIKNKGDGVCDG